MGVVERRAREKEALRARILEAASALFVEEGYENVSIRKIADRIEYSPATIYLYFKDKAELITAICEESFREMLDTIGVARESSQEPLEALRRGMRAYVDFGITHPSHYHILFGMPTPEPAHAVCDHPAGLALQTFDLLRTAIRACMDAGAIPASDVETAAQVTWMALHGVTSLAIVSAFEPQGGFPWLERGHLIDSALDLITAGLRHSTFSPATA
jgi:AcrR family transcriptional regulator